MVIVRADKSAISQNLPVPGMVRDLIRERKG